MGLSYIALDFETANSSRESACALGMTKVINGNLVESISQVFKPPEGFDHFDSRNISIHRITPATVKEKDRFEKVWPRFYEFTEGLPVVAHNASFDMSVLRGSLRASNLEWPEMEYACTWVMSKKLFQIAAHSLPFVAREAKILWDETKHHEAEYDANVCAEIVLSMASAQGVDSLEELLTSLELSMGVLYSDGWLTCRSNSTSQYSHHSVGESNLRPSDVETNTNANPDHPFYNKRIVFTGRLASVTRPDAWHLVAQVGGIPKDAMTKSTNVLVLGEQDLDKLKPGETQSTKFREAEKLRNQGMDIEVMSESEFLSFLEPEGIIET